MSSDKDDANKDDNKKRARILLNSLIGPIRESIQDEKSEDFLNESFGYTVLSLAGAVKNGNRLTFK